MQKEVKKIRLEISRNETKYNNHRRTRRLDIIRRTGIMNKRLGKIRICDESYELLWQSPINIIPYSIRHMPHKGLYEIECSCEGFRELEETDKIPSYEITFLRINNLITIESIKELDWDLWQ